MKKIKTDYILKLSSKPSIFTIIVQTLLWPFEVFWSSFGKNIFAQNEREIKAITYIPLTPFDDLIDVGEKRSGLMSG